MKTTKLAGNKWVIYNKVMYNINQKARAREFYRRRHGQTKQQKQFPSTAVSAATAVFPGSPVPIAKPVHDGPLSPKSCRVKLRMNCPGDLKVQPAFQMRKAKNGSIIVSIRLTVTPNEIAKFPSTPEDMLRFLPYLQMSALE